MSTHVNDVRIDMFSESCNEVKRLLVAMCNQVEQTMTSRTDEGFMQTATGLHRGCFRHPNAGWPNDAKMGEEGESRYL
jgi:hypothetical protein